MSAASITTDTTVTCANCGQEWPRHPCLDVICPLCQAAVGQRCRRPSGHAGPFVDFHVDREQAALDAGILRKCPRKSDFF